MYTWKQIFRVVQTIAVPILFSFVINHFASKTKDSGPPPSTFVPILRDIGFVPRKFPVTYRLDSSDFQDYERVQDVTTGAPDTTAVVLNWARFPNVLLITSLLCGPWLDDTISQVYIWNNSPKRYTYEDFKNTGCTKEKLKIHNAPSNVYFQGRFMACGQSNTPYCFIQDDDYLVRPEIIRALRARIGRSDSPHAIHLLPPHEHLSTSLREIHVSKPDPSYRSDMHTSFAWLGHGTIMHRSQAEDFMFMMRRLRASPDEMKMADNYFTILSNRVPEIWFDQDFGLGGGHAFTVGPEGDERNTRHIQRAIQYLDAIAHCNAASCPTTDVSAQRAKMPYTSVGGHPPPISWTRAACSGSSCILETNIRLLPDAVSHTSDSIEHMLSVGEKNFEVLGEAGKQHYQEHPPSHAVDTHADTFFQSPDDAKKGDIVLIDVLADVSNVHEWNTIEMVWLVDPSTEKVLKASTFESSLNNEIWRKAAHQPICDDTDIESPIDSSITGATFKTYLRECSIQMVIASNALHLRATGRYFRARLEEDQTERWTVYEVWLRGL
ncbi:hypothetical protein AcV5_005015 [Taiwanofungus camphoratus]|nr:hypothetical protein AcV5_005015 [Antrodia cinnamomea]